MLAAFNEMEKKKSILITRSFWLLMAPSFLALLVISCIVLLVPGCQDVLLLLQERIMQQFMVISIFYALELILYKSIFIRFEGTN